MSVSELLDELASSGVELSLDGNELRFRDPKGALTDDLRRQIADQRETVIRRLRGQSELDGSPAGEKCRRCDMRDWVDEPPKDGRIRTHCRRCGRFIGYRPENLGTGAGK